MGVDCTEATGGSYNDDDDDGGASRQRLPAVPASFELLATSDEFSNGPADVDLLVLSLVFGFVLAANFKVENIGKCYNLQLQYSFTLQLTIFLFEMIIVIFVIVDDLHRLGRLSSGSDGTLLRGGGGGRRNGQRRSGGTRRCARLRGRSHCEYLALTSSDVDTLRSLDYQNLLTSWYLATR